MMPPEFQRRRQKSVLFVALILFALILFLIQLWLFVMVFENSLAGHADMAIPAAVGSCVILCINIWMLQGVKNLMSNR